MRSAGVAARGHQIEELAGWAGEATREVEAAAQVCVPARIAGRVGNGSGLLAEGGDTVTAVAAIGVTSGVGLHGCADDGIGTAEVLAAETRGRKGGDIRSATANQD